MSTRKPRTEISTIVSSTPFEHAVALALVEISAVDATRREYRRDFDLWLRFCGERNVDPESPMDGSVAAWLAWMKSKNHAPKSRQRRIAALSSIYRELRRRKVVPGNPFGPDEGPRRERNAAPLEPTPIATPDVVRTVIAGCNSDPSSYGVRDAAMIRILWATGMRRVSLVSMTIERLQKDRAGYVATVAKKGGGTQRVLITGGALRAFQAWLKILREGFRNGPVWRRRSGEPLSERDIHRVIAKRAKVVGESLSPHMLRVSFLTYNPAGLEAKQEAAGHANPATTRLYDRDAWRGREAFEKMPEIEDASE